MKVAINMTPHVVAHGWPKWPWMGGLPYQALLLLQFFMYNIRAREKIRKGEGEPGNEATHTTTFLCIIARQIKRAMPVATMYKYNYVLAMC